MRFRRRLQGRLGGEGSGVIRKSGFYQTAELVPVYRASLQTKILDLGTDPRLPTGRSG